VRAHRWTDSSINSTNQRSALSAPLSAVPLAALHCLLTLAPHARPQSAAFGCFASCTTVCGATAAQTAASASVLRSSRLTHRTAPLRFARVTGMHESWPLAIDRGTSVVSRLWVSVCSSCPVQAHYLAFVSSMGASYIDAVLTDRVASPPDLSRYYDERLVLLPPSYFPSGTSRVLECA
jgi:hypothetical protein